MSVQRPVAGAYPFEVGSHTRRVTTASADAQIWFDRGLNWTYGYNQDEAIRCFERALAADPTCAMAHWGLAYAYGPYLNKEWRFYADQELDRCLPIMHDHARRAADLATTSNERALGEALTARYPQPAQAPLDVMTGWDDDFASAMSDVYEQFPDDLDVAAVCAEALMMRTPWRLWDLDSGEPAPGASTLEILGILDRAIDSQTKADPTHPGIAHMICHTLEMSGEPERAIPAADSLRDIARDNAHLLHMPGHIDVLCGNYLGAVETSERAIAADLAYLDLVGPYGQYTAAICHDNHLMMFASMLLGRWQSAIDAADVIARIVTDDVLRASTPAFQITLEAYLSMRMHPFVRFGKWHEILEQPAPADPLLCPVSTAMHHYAQAIANAALSRPGDADRSMAEFERTVADISEERHLFNNTSQTVLAVGRQMMLGEVAYHRGEHELGFSHLREAVRLNDDLNYTEPWAWMHPPRHALGALLLQQGQVEEAEAVYLADLGLDGLVRRCNVHPDNVWALHGYVECLDRTHRGDEADAWRERLTEALRHADVEVTSSCACRIEPATRDDCCH